MMTFGDFAQRSLTVKRRVIHDHDISRRKLRQELFLEPIFKNRRVCGAIIIHGRDGSSADLRGDEIRPLEFHPGNLSENFFSSRSVAVFPVIVGVKAGFVRINAIFRRNAIQCFLIRLYFFRLPLFVAARFFLRVMSGRFNALLTA